jgi:hypothetical protein
VITRMWEARISGNQLDEFFTWLRDAAWPQFTSAQGFSGGDAYRSDEQGSAVVITHWSDSDALAAGNTWFDLGAERFCARAANAWQFTPVPMN